MAYEGEREMFEAYGSTSTASTGVIQWMLNTRGRRSSGTCTTTRSVPGPGAFLSRKTQKACEPLHVQYSYDDRPSWW